MELMAPGWACPQDGRPLQAGREGLECADCARAYPVVDGIPCFAGELPAEQRFEQAFRDRCLTFEGDRRVAYERAVEAEAVARRLRLTGSDTLLDAGCGIGGITRRFLASAARVVGLDFSLHRLQTLRAAAGAGAARLQLGVADVTRLPLPSASCTAAVCTQVLEHLPGAERRRALLAGLRRVLRPGGTLLLTVYNYSRPWRRRGQPKEGTHETGIFYHCYDSAELAAELEGFEVEELSGLLHLLPRTYHLLPRLGRLGRSFDHALERPSAWSRDWGHLLLVRARRR